MIRVERKWLYLSIVILLIIAIILFITLKNENWELKQDIKNLEQKVVEKSESPSFEEPNKIGRTVECTQHSQCPEGLCSADFKCVEPRPGAKPVGFEEY